MSPSDPAVTQPDAVAVRPFARALSVTELAIASLRENALLIAATVLYGTVCELVRHRYGLKASPLDGLPIAYLGFVMFASVGGFCVFALWFLYLSRIKQVADPLGYVSQQVRTKYFSPERLALAIPVLLLWPVFVNTFSYLKALIPVFQPFAWDAALAHWDRALHFGRLPSDWLGPLLSHPLPTLAITWFYTIWFFVIMAMLLLQVGNTANRRLRAQYLLTQAILWPLLGNVAATVLSSAGPCYYGLIVAGANPYAAHMADLTEIAQRLSFTLFGHSIQLAPTLSLQQFLWDGYQNERLTVGEGISACPSLHVASSWLVARLSMEYGRKAAIFGFGFLGMILVGSVHLGWHYAIDGYLGIIGGWLCWRLAGFLLACGPVSWLLWGSRHQVMDPRPAA